MKFLSPDTSTSKEHNLVDHEFSEDSVYAIVDFKIQKWQTAPPPYLSEHELIRLMEKNRIGTDGTIPLHIQKIIFRNYVAVANDIERIEQNGKIAKLETVRRFLPTKIGIALAEGFQKIDKELIEPEVRKYVEVA
jgi:DNA topoisomerase III